ncbi:hypothetical protein M0R72_14725 [Candidatus Pacearchaeota archaeon]|nr:hypothetical protein [Candidatus Pacearchaeota archaeon]
MLINRKSLLTQLMAVFPGLSSKEVIEQSGSFVFQDGRVTTFNDEVACSIECKLGITGAVVADPLLALLQKLDEDEISIEQSDGELLVKAGKRKAGIRMSAEITLPVDGIENPDKWIKLPKELSDAIGIVQGCASNNESEFVLTCIHLHPKYVEAADQFQIARYSLVTGLDDSILVRRSAMKSAMGMGVTELSQTENWLHFRNSAGLTISCRRYNRAYPSLDKYLEVDGVDVYWPEGLGEAIDKAKIFSKSDDDNLITVDLRSGKMKMTGRGPHGWYSEVQKVEGYDGGDVQFTISPNLLLELPKRSNKCVIGEGRLKLQSGKWVCVFCTVVEDKNNDS